MNHIHSKPRGTRDTFSSLGSFIQECLDNPDKDFAYCTLEDKSLLEQKFKSLGFEMPANMTVFSPNDHKNSRGGRFEIHDYTKEIEELRKSIM